MTGHRDIGLDPITLDLPDLLNRVEGDRALIDQLTVLFKGECPALLDGLQRALESRNAQDVHSLAHKLKGAAGNLSAPRVASSVQRLTERADRCDWSGATEELQALRLEIQKLIAELQECAKQVAG